MNLTHSCPRTRGFDRSRQRSTPEHRRSTRTSPCDEPRRPNAHQSTAMRNGISQLINQSIKTISVDHCSFRAHCKLFQYMLCKTTEQIARGADLLVYVGVKRCPPSFESIVTRSGPANAAEQAPEEQHGEARTVHPCKFQAQSSNASCKRA